MDDHQETVRLFREVDNVDKALNKKFSNALLDLYLKRFRNRQMNTLHNTIPDILQYLFATYGDLTPEELSATAKSLKTKVFDITHPLIIMYNKVYDLEDIVTASNNAYLDTKIINLVIQLIKTCAISKRDIDWYVRPTGEHT